MNFPTIYLPVESKKREFDGKILLAAHLVKAGFKVVMGTKAGVHRELMHARNGLYLAKSASNTSLGLYRELKKREHHLAVLDVEGGALTREIRNDLLRSYQPEASPFFDYFYVFGEKIREAILQNLNYIRPDQVVVTGEPRFDLLKPEYRRFFEADRIKIQQQYGRFILINTSFGLSNSAIGEEGIKHFLLTTGDIPDEQRHLYLLKHEEGKFLLHAFIELAHAIAVRFPWINIVVRPHPDEESAVYEKAFKDSENIFMDGSGNVHPWIQSAMAVIHHDCTTGMEAAMAGKPVISYVPRQEESITAWLPVWLSIACQSTMEVLKALEPVVSGETTHYLPEPEKQEVFAAYFENYRSLAAEKLTAHLIQQYMHLATSRVNIPGLLFRRMKSDISTLIARNRQKGGLWERFKEVHQEEVVNKLNATGVFESGKLLAVVTLGGNAVIIELE
jgi:surface carbohydrate biosynthesis protein